MSRQYHQSLIAAVLILFSVGIVSAQGPDSLWMRTFGGGARESAVETSDGKYIIAGRTSGGAYLAKTDANGDVIWEMEYAGIAGAAAYSVEQTSDGGYIMAGSNYTGAYGNNAYLIKTDPDGDTLWTGRYVTYTTSVAFSVQQTSDGGYITAGTLCGMLRCHAFLVKTNEFGQSLWERSDYGVWNRTQNANSVQQTLDGGYIVAGNTTAYTAGRDDVWLIKVDEYGDTLWTRRYGGTQIDKGYSVRQTSDGGYVITGFTISSDESRQDVYLIKTDADGDTVWTRTCGIGIGYCVRQTDDDGYIIAGSTNAYGAGSNDIYLVRTDASGNIIWTTTFGGVLSDNGRSVELTSDGGYIIAGETSSFGAGGLYVYLVKTEPDPVASVTPTDSPGVDPLCMTISPNPSKTGILIKYSLPTTKDVFIDVCDLNGRKLVSVVNDRKRPGPQTVIWNTRDYQGRRIPPGIYFIRLQAGDQVATRKVVLIR